MITTTQDRKRADLLAGLAMHTGTTIWFRHWTGRFTYTEGVKFLAEQAGAYWLIDLVASWCPHAAIRCEGFVVWKLAVRADHSATITAEDGNGRVLIAQEIAFTDFPLEGVSFYLIDNVLLLPSEY